MKEIIINLPDMDSVLGIALRGAEIELQYQGGLVRFPKPEEMSPDSCYSIRMSIKNAQQVVSYLSQAIAQASKAP